MSVRCKHVQQALAASTAEQLAADALLQKHVRDCAECSGTAAALHAVDDELFALPLINPPEHLVDRVLAEARSIAPAIHLAIHLVHSGSGADDSERPPSLAHPRETRMGRALAIGSAFAAAAAVALVSFTSITSSDRYTPSEASSREANYRVARRAPGPERGPAFHGGGAGGGGSLGVKGESEVAEIDSLIVVDDSGFLDGEGQEPDSGGRTGGQIGLPSASEGMEGKDFWSRDRRREDRGKNIDRDGERFGWLEKKPEVVAANGSAKTDEDGRYDNDEGLNQELPSGTALADQPTVENGKSIEPGNHRIDLSTSPLGGLVTTDELDHGEVTLDPTPLDPDSTKSGTTIAAELTRNIPVPGRAFESTLGKAAPGSQEDSTSTGLDATSTDKWVGLRFSVDDPNYDSHELQGAEGRGEVSERAEKQKETKAIDEKRVLSETVAPQVAQQAVARQAKEQLAYKTPATKALPATPEPEKLVQSTRARGFVAEREKHVGVPTVVANGFWSNNYIPGDPQLRLLAARLAGDPSAAQLGSLDASVAPYPQLFDAPKTSALAVSVRSDRRAADGPSRMLIQVGLKGTDRQAGGRPALNIGIVLDLGNTPDEAATAMRGLLSALRDARRRGDRFSLTVANRGGGLVLTPEQFRNGPLRVAMQVLFSNETNKRSALSLGEAVAIATEQVAATDDPNGPLGRSMVLIVTASPVSTTVDRELQELAHANAVNGIGLSTIGVGAAVDDGQLLRWAAAGHGNRRLLLRADDAGATIASELAAAESVVARAVRVRVKLAPGVKLVEVVGSKRLGARAAARTREAEISIDRRVAKARGIASDREKDEDGVKIIIPSFSAGDSHVILLDVIADGPGALADVAVSYKDLVHLRNGAAKAALSLRRGRAATEGEKGPFERGVFQNYVGSIISQRLGTAGALLEGGDTDGANVVVADLHDLLQGLQLERPWLRRDAAFARDVATVKRFNDVLQAGVAETSRAYVANSLSYAAWRKIVPVRREAN